MYNDEDLCCAECKGNPQLLNIEDENTPVYLMSAAGFELQRVKTALEDSGIPTHSAVRKSNVSPHAATGYDSSEYDILVPYSAYEKAYDVCVGVGAIKIGEEEILGDDGTDVNSGLKSQDELFEKMSGAKRTTVRVAMALLFLALVALAVFGTDFIMNIIKGFFG